LGQITDLINELPEKFEKEGLGKIKNEI